MLGAGCAICAVLAKAVGVTVCAGGWDLGAAGSVGAEAVCCEVWVSRLATFEASIGWCARACTALACVYVAGV